jgi:transcriptional regulator with XRE-family HTH domain
MGNHIGATIKRLRKEKGLALKEVKPTGKSVSWLSRVEKGEQRDITVTDFLEIAERLGCRPGQLVAAWGEDGAESDPAWVREVTAIDELFEAMRQRADLRARLEEIRAKNADRPGVFQRVVRAMAGAFAGNVGAIAEGIELSGP